VGTLGKLPKLKSALTIGRVRGIEISIHWTFLLLIAWIVVSSWQAGQSIVTIGWSILFVSSIFVCVILHELGHAMMALRFNIKTRSIVLYPIGGIARLETIPKKSREELLVALAGPAVNLAIAGLLYPLSDSSLLNSAESLNITNSAIFITSFVVVNFWLATFNLIPAFPMDGGRVLRALLSFRMSRERATRIATRVGQFFAIAFIMIGFYVNPFLILIGIFVIFSAQAELNYVRAETLFEGHRLASITMHNFPLLQANNTLQEAARQMLDSQQKNFLVMDGDAIIGTLSHQDVVETIRKKGSDTPAREAADKDSLYLSSDVSIEEALLSMQQRGKSVAIVTENNHFIGMVDNDNLTEFIVLQDANAKYKESLQ
jgi:Zn-dependent protease/predicted transcriptional regulator